MVRAWYIVESPFQKPLVTDFPENLRFRYLLFNVKYPTKCPKDIEHIYIFNSLDGEVNDDESRNNIIGLLNFETLFGQIISFVTYENVENSKFQYFH